MAFVIEAAEHFGFADGGTGHACTYADGAPAVGEFDVLCVNSDTTVSTPTGFTAAESAVTNQGAYIFTRQAAGGEAASVTLTTNGNHNCNVLWVRISGGNTLDLAESAQINGTLGTSSAALTTSTLAASGELALAFSAMHSYSSGTPASPSWSAGYTNIITGGQGSGGGTSAAGFVAYKTPAGTAAESPSVTWTNTAEERYLLFVSFTAAASGSTVTGALAATTPAVTAGFVGVAPVNGVLAGTAPAVTAALTGTAPVVVSTAGASWYGLLNIAQEARQIAAEQAARPPVACPNDGEPLRIGPHGELFCPFDGWRPDGGLL